MNEGTELNRTEICVHSLKTSPVFFNNDSSNMQGGDTPGEHFQLNMIMYVKHMHDVTSGDHHCASINHGGFDTAVKLTGDPLGLNLCSCLHLYLIKRTPDVNGAVLDDFIHHL